MIYPGHADYSDLSQSFVPRLGARAIIRVVVTRISDSCGFGVPRLDFVEQRDAMDRWAEKKGLEGLSAYREEKNQMSIDGIPGYKNE